MPKQPTEYIGDGVYAIYDGYGIWLHTGDHREHLAENKVFLEPEVFESLMKFADKFYKRKDGKKLWKD